LFRLLWVAVGIFVLATALNYLDRQILAPLAPEIRAEFGLSNTGYGLILSAFSITYALSAPAAGLLIDRIGLNRGMTLIVALWSMVGISTGLAGSFGVLLFLRGALWLTESGGIPGSGKAIALYLPPRERSLGTALNQIGLTLGAAGAPLIATWLALHYGWRSAFVVTGALGFVWIPLWLYTAKRIPPLESESVITVSGAAEMLVDRRLWAFVGANVLSMALYSLWLNLDFPRFCGHRVKPLSVIHTPLG